MGSSSECGPVLDTSVDEKYSCPICYQLLCKPIRLPCQCSNRILCLQCFQTHIQTQDRTCPFCRVFLVHWSKKCENYVDQDLWNEIQKLYPSEAKKRVEGVDSSFCLKIHRTYSSPQLAETGELRCWYEQEMAKLQAEKEIEDKKSEEYIEKLREEEEARNKEIERADDILASRIQNLDNSVDVAAVLKEGKEQLDERLNTSTAESDADKPVRPEDLQGYEPEDKPKDGEPDKIIYPKRDVDLSRQLAGEMIEREAEGGPEENERQNNLLGEVNASISLEEMYLELSQGSDNNDISDAQPFDADSCEGDLNLELSQLSQCFEEQQDFPSTSAQIVEDTVDDEVDCDQDVADLAASPNSIDEPNPTRFQPVQPEPTSPVKKNESGRALPNDILQVEPLRPVIDNKVTCATIFQPLPELQHILETTRDSVFSRDSNVFPRDCGIFSGDSSMFKEPMAPPSTSKVYKQQDHRTPTTSPSKKDQLANYPANLFESEDTLHVKPDTSSICSLLNETKVSYATSALEKFKDKKALRKLSCPNVSKKNAKAFEDLKKITRKQADCKQGNRMVRMRNCRHQRDEDTAVTETAPPDLMTTPQKTMSSLESRDAKEVSRNVTVRKRKQRVTPKPRKRKPKNFKRVNTRKCNIGREATVDNGCAAKHIDSPIVKSVHKRNHRCRGEVKTWFTASGDGLSKCKAASRTAMNKSEDRVITSKVAKKRRASRTVSSQLSLSSSHEMASKLNRSFEDELNLSSMNKGFGEDLSSSQMSEESEAPLGIPKKTSDRPKTVSAKTRKRGRPKKVDDCPNSSPPPDVASTSGSRQKSSHRALIKYTRDEKIARSLQRAYNDNWDIEYGAYSLRKK